MLRKVLVEVTTEDILFGDVHSNTDCMVARALTRATGIPWQCCTYKASYDNPEGKSFKLPALAEIKIRHQIYFACGERGNLVEPFSFEFEYDDSYLTEKTPR